MSEQTLPRMLSPTAIPRASLGENLRFNALVILPMVLQGLYRRSRFWSGLVSRWHPDPLALRFCRRLRARHGDYIQLRLLTRPCVLVLDPAGIRRVLDNSPALYAEPASKRRGMGHFQPGAVTISRGAAWAERRRFNEAVLAAVDDAVPAIVEDEVARLLARHPGRLDWDAFAGLFEAIGLQIVLGPGARDLKLADQLTAMMGEANRGKRRQSRHFAPFYARLGNALRYPLAGGLAMRASRTPATRQTRVQNQIPHWLFALKDTLAENTVRALASILAHPAVLARVREALADADLATPAGLERLPLLRGCIQEAMRLWPTTPMLAREAVVADVLGPGMIPAGMQIAILNGFNHRDDTAVANAQGFEPTRWGDDTEPDYRFNHLSNGAQSCPGKRLALVVATAVLGRLLLAGDYRLVAPQLAGNQPLPESLDVFRVVVARV